ncbi:glycoside hydrolase family 43 protein [Piromyces sp. E2]|nr:glycoside hydrolase family 43 protein [Piromyces sp. E2]|eukprot:OUM66339.1 glycoside hydrolase family 43 protein [Piromyces sp. E2]
MNDNKILIFSFIILLLLEAILATSTVYNPIIWADVPDPDIIRVGETYYMVSTTMFFSPGAPIMKSKDLVSWEICHYVYDILADGDIQTLQKDRHDYSHGQWATSLRYHEGTFYVFFGSYGTNKSYIFKTKDIENGKWSRHEINGMYHDASLLFDDDGKNYLIYGGGGEIKIKEFNSEMTDFKMGGADKTLFKTNLSGLAGEGSHVQKINDYYYIFIIAWPSGKGRIEICYRSRNLFGNYENKTVLDSGVGSYSSGVAQGGIVQTPDGKWYGLLFQDHGSGSRVAKSDEFNYSSDKLDLVWQWNHNPDNSAWSVTDRKGWLRLKNMTIASELLRARNTLTMRTEGPACSSIVKLDTTNLKIGDFAGLSAFQFNYGNVGVYVSDNGEKYIYMANNGGYDSNNDVTASRNNIVEQTKLNGNEIYLKLDFRFSNVENDGSASWNIDKVIEVLYSVIQLKTPVVMPISISSNMNMKNGILVIFHLMHLNLNKLL